MAINDGIVLESCIYRILQKHFRRSPCYSQLLELFHEVFAFLRSALSIVALDLSHRSFHAMSRCESSLHAACLGSFRDE